MKIKLLLLVPLVLALSTEAGARRRRAPRGTGQVSGALQVKGYAAPEASRAYWSFGVAELQTKLPPPPFDEVVVYLDVWDEAALPDSGQPELAVEGAEVAPPLLVIPRRSDAARILFRNQDGFTYRFQSKDHAELRSLILPPRAKENVKLEGIPHKEAGGFVRYRIVTREQPLVRGEILLLRSSAFARPDAQGRFVLKGLPSGPRTLRVLFRGRILLEKKVEIGRRPLDLGALPIHLAAKTPRAK